MPTDRMVLIENIAGVLIEHGYEGATLTELAKATGLSKASLYHHFPSGKAEMAQVVIRHAAELLQNQAFRHLQSSDAAALRLHRFIDGFDAYVQNGAGHCLVAVLAQGTLKPQLNDAIVAQFSEWSIDLGRTYEALSLKPKAARREAAATLNQLYGALVIAKIMGDTKPYRQTLKRMHKSIDRLAELSHAEADADAS